MVNWVTLVLAANEKALTTRDWTVKELCENFVILRPDKGGGIVLMNRTDYNKKIEFLFSDKKKFKVLQEDPTPTRLKSLQSYLLTLKNRGEITAEIYKRIRPSNAKPARAHGLPKTHIDSIVYS